MAPRYYFMKFMTGCFETLQESVQSFDLVAQTISHRVSKVKTQIDLKWSEILFVSTSGTTLRSIRRISKYPVYEFIIVFFHATDI